jgi:hypothetical protein
VVLLKIHTPNSPVSEAEYKLVFVEDSTYSLLLENEYNDNSSAGFMKALLHVGQNDLMSPINDVNHFKNEIEMCDNTMMSARTAITLQQHYGDLQVLNLI